VKPVRVNGSRTGRRALALGAVLSLVPTAGALILVRPAAAADPVYDQVGVTAIVSGVRTDGVVGASGGLVTLDGGSAYISGRLDSSPSAQVLAAPYEPGTLVRTGVGQVNGGAGQTVLTVPDADARYPGPQNKSTCCQVPPLSQPPLSFGAAAATAETGPAVAKGTSTGASYGVAGALSVGPSSSTLAMTVSAAAGQVVQDARTAVSHVDVAGVLVLQDVVATASIKTDRDTHAAVQSLTVGGASVAGQSVVLGNNGVTAVGTALIPGQTLEAATAQANAQLAAAGITVHTIGGAAKHDTRSATADSGGVEIVLGTPVLPGGVAANSLTVVVGGVALTEIDTLSVPLVPPVIDVPPVTGGHTGTSTTTFVPGTPGSPGLPASPGAVGPQVAPPAVATAFVVSGRRISARTALIAFAGWQLLSLGSATLYAFVERRRRLVLMGRPA
jgi:hypothetical protein